MTVVYLPVLKLGVAYSISSGRRWSVLEHMLLVELSARDRSVAELAEAASLPPRMIVEALIALLKANWVQVRADATVARFTATAIGRKRASEDEELPVYPRRDVRWTSLCFDRVTGAWLRSDDLKLVYQSDLPEDAQPLEPHYSTMDANDGAFRELLPLKPDETLEPEEPRLRSPSRPYARFDVSFDSVEGLPAYAPARLREVLLESAAEQGDVPVKAAEAAPPSGITTLRDTLSEADLIVGGEAHLEMLRRALKEAESSLVLHSCFVHPMTVERLLPDFAAAAQRGVRIELLWGLRRDSEEMGNPPSIKDSVDVLRQLSPAQQKRVTLSQISSGSHAKVLVWDATGQGWRSVLGSCNWLSSWYDALEVSLHARSPGLARNLLGWLVSAQLPASGEWSPQARRLNALWNRARSAAACGEVGEHRLMLLVDDDHFALIRTARDRAQNDIVLGCDLFGSAAETSSLVPMARAAELGRQVTLAYARPSRRLTEEGREPSAADLEARGLQLRKVEKLHGKFLLWDEQSFAASSFNWLSTVPDTRTRGAELGLLVEGADLRNALRTRLALLADQMIIP